MISYIFCRRRLDHLPEQALRGDRRDPPVPAGEGRLKMSLE